jgi:hypothetical protein
MVWTKAQFLSVLDSAHKAERAWVEQQRGHGLAIAHGAKLVLPDHNPRKDFCPTPDAVAAVALEIKVRGLTFTSPSDFPYPTVFVDDLNGLRHGTPFAWIYISQRTGSWVWLSALDRDDSWTEQTVWDSMRGFNVPTLVAPSKCLRRAEQLCDMLFRADGLQWVEGEVGGFGGEVPAPSQRDPAPRGRGRKAPKDSG